MKGDEECMRGGGLYIAVSIGARLIGIPLVLRRRRYYQRRIS